MPVLLLVLGGCASIPDQVRQLDDAAAYVELANTPFHSQERYQCGPAALLTALQASGAAATLGEIVAKVYLPGRKGSLQAEMIAATRTSDRVPYRLEGTLAAILAELDAGRPVVVLQNLGINMYPRWHYAVVVGIDPLKDEVILRSGTDKRRVTRTKTFLYTWRRSNYWAFVALRPGELPANLNQGRYFEAVAGLEQVGRNESAAAAWQAALEKWPGNPVALFGFANVRYAQANWQGAVDVYRQLLAGETDMPAARNNLAMALLELGRYRQALDEIELAIASTEDPYLLPEFQKTRAVVLEFSSRN